MSFLQNYVRQILYIAEKKMRLLVFLLLSPLLVFSQFNLVETLSFEVSQSYEPSFVQTDNDDFVVTGGRYSGSRVFKTTENGEIIFETFLSGFFPTSVKQSSENFIITKRVGTGGTYTTAIVEIDNSGNIVFESSIPDGGDANDVLVLENNKYFVSGGTQPCGCGGSWDARATLFSSSEVEWSNSFCVNCGCSCNVGDEIHRESIDVGSGIIVCGRAGTGGSYSYGQDDGYLIKYDYAGNHLWTQIHGENDKYTSYMSIEESDNNIIGVGRYIDDEAVMTEEPADIWVVKSDLDGNIIWEKNIGDPDTPEVGYDIMLTDYGTYIISGVINEYNDASQIWLVELDSEGYLLYDTIIETSYSHARIGHQSLLMNEDNELFVIYSDDNNIYISKFQMYNEDLDQSCLSDTSYTEATACDSYVWNSQTYLESGTYEHLVIEADNNYSMSFGGNSNDFENYVEIPSSPTFSLQSEFTFNAWVKVPEMHNSWWGTVIGAYNTNGWQLYVGGNSFNINGAIQFERLGCEYIAGTTDLRDNEWHYISVVIENGVISIYIDGQLEVAVNDDSCLPGGGSNINSNEVFFGEANHNHGQVENFPGEIDEISIWHKTLSNQEIQQYMICSPLGNEEGLVGYWNFEEGSGATVYDQTNNGNNGTINGAEYSSETTQQLCQLTTIDGCDSVAVLNLTIIGVDTSITEVTACDSHDWNGITYTESGTYHYDSESVNNELSLGFNGAGDYISISDNPSIDISDESFSIEVWIKKDTPYNNGTTAAIVGSRQPGSAGSAGFMLGLNGGYYNNGPEGTIQWWLRSSNNNEHGFMSESDITDGQWHHLVAVKNSEESSMSLYFDGVLENTIPIVSGNTWSDQGLFLGNCCPNSALIDFEIDNFKFWNKALNQEDVTKSYNCNSITDNSELILNWSFDEEDLTDYSGNENHGVNLGGTYSTDVPEQFCQLTTANGCDSVAVLNLTILETDSSFTEVTACESYEWNGTTYTEGGSFTHSEEQHTNENSMSFDGTANKHITLSNVINFGVNSFSVSVDCYLNAFEGNDPENYSYIVGVPLVGATNDHGFKIQTISSNVNNGGFSAHINDAGNQYFNLIEIDNSNTSNIILNKWYDLTIVVDRDNDNFMFYVDGLLIESQVISENFGDVDSGIPISLGHMSANNTSRLNGKTDNLHIWSKALSENEVQNFLYCPPIGTEENLVGYWNFEEGSGSTVFDLTSNGNNGTIIGATYSTDAPEQSCPLTSVTGCDSIAVLNLTITEADTSTTEITTCESYEWNGEIYTESGIYFSNTSSNNNHSIMFDGVNDYIETNNISLVDEVTWGCKINPSSFAFGSGNTNHIIGKFNSGSGNNREFVLELDAGELKINIFNQYLNQWHTASSGYVLNLNEWVSIAASYNKNSTPSLKLYIDGALVGTDDSYNSSINATTVPVRISGITYPFDGMIDDVFIYDRELSITEIQQYMNCPSVNESGLVAYWSFEEGEGETAIDLSGNDNNGTIIGATYSTDTPEQSCPLTSVTGCDSVAVLNLTINQSDTSFTEVIACESYEWNGTTYIESGTYEVSYQNTNDNFSIDFNGQQDYIQFDNFGGYSNNFSVSADIKLNNESSSPQAIFSGVWRFHFRYSGGISKIL